jgi:ketosteroid isomerase-like protein
MARSIFAIFATVALALGSPALAAGAQALPADLARALEAYNEATVHNDTAALARIVTDDYMLVNSDMSVQDKRSYLADFLVPGFKVDPYVVEQPVYRVRGDAALTGGMFQLGWTQDGSHHSRRLRIAHFWVRQDGRWRIAYTQLTRLPEQR